MRVNAIRVAHEARHRNAHVRYREAGHEAGPYRVFKAIAHRARDLLAQSGAGLDRPYVEVEIRLTIAARQVVARQGLAFANEDHWRDVRPLVHVEYVVSRT